MASTCVFFLQNDFISKSLETKFFGKECSTLRGTFVRIYHAHRKLIVIKILKFPVNYILSIDKQSRGYFLRWQVNRVLDFYNILFFLSFSHVSWEEVLIKKWYFYSDLIRERFERDEFAHDQIYKNPEGLDASIRQHFFQRNLFAKRYGWIPLFWFTLF